MSVKIEVFVTEACPCCAGAEKLVAETVAALGEEKFELRIVDVVEELDRAVAIGVLRVPAIAIGGTLAVTGQTTASRLLPMLQDAAAAATQSGFSAWRNIG